MLMGSGPAATTTTDSTRIMHLLEASVPVDDHPPLVPCTSDTKVYQRHVYFTAMLDQVKRRARPTIYLSSTRSDNRFQLFVPRKMLGGD